MGMNEEDDDDKQKISIHTECTFIVLNQSISISRTTNSPH